jgi:hypothetical protein
MIGFVVSVMRGNFEEDEIERIHKDDYIKFIPKVPGEGESYLLTFIKV